jgi:hypothetical protein
VIICHLFPIILKVLIIFVPFIYHPCLLFIMGHVLGGRVTVTDGKLQDIFIIMNMSLLNG